MTGKIQDGKRYRLKLWHGGAEDGSSPQFPPREVEGEVRSFDQDGETRYEVVDATMKQPDAEGGDMVEEGVTIGFLPDHVLDSEVLK